MTIKFESISLLTKYNSIISAKNCTKKKNPQIFYQGFPQIFQT